MFHRCGEHRFSPSPAWQIIVLKGLSHCSGRNFWLPLQSVKANETDICTGHLSHLPLALLSTLHNPASFNPLFSGIPLAVQPSCAAPAAVASMSQWEGKHKGYSSDDESSYSVLIQWVIPGNGQQKKGSMSVLLTGIFAPESQRAVERLLYKQQSSLLCLHRSLRLFICPHIFLVIE